MNRRRFITNTLALPTLMLLRPIQASTTKNTGKQPELLLQESPIAGFQYYDGEIVFYDLYPGLALQLKREPNNRRDPNAVEIHSKLGKLGYVPRAENTALAQMMDRGVELKAELTRLKESTDTWQMARFKVWV